MPRKKKSTLERKPSLVFTESPINIQRNLLSPVLCARHPPTASSIPIENLQNLSWVSPQFRNVSSSGGHRRLRKSTRQRRHSLATHRHLHNAHQLDSGCHGNSNHPAKLKKFNSLRFVGERTCASIVEEVEITVETDTASDEENVDRNKISVISSPNRGNRNTKNVNNISYITINNKNVSSEDTSKEDSITSESNDDQTVNPLKLKAPVKRLFASQLGNNHKLSCDEFLNESTTCTSSKVGQDRLLTIQSQTVSESEEESTIPLRRSTRLKHLYNLLNLSDSPCRKTGPFKTVLAPDTPENEYGWSKRKRQLIKYVKKSS
ncbi:hypothetical protein ACF0H5_015763 [Mactra antiquata]